MHNKLLVMLASGSQKGVLHEYFDGLAYSTLLHNFIGICCLWGISLELAKILNQPNSKDHILSTTIDQVGLT